MSDKTKITIAIFLCLTAILYFAYKMVSKEVFESANVLTVATKDKDNSQVRQVDFSDFFG